ncbi:MAG TPA: hypothetical protein PLN52_11610, partial [Opitutaceae bacterium]|nr:hypothetical protein [Opitutaceae bacterium]
MTASPTLSKTAQILLSSTGLHHLFSSLAPTKCTAIVAFKPPPTSPRELCFNLSPRPIISNPCRRSRHSE